MKTSFFYALKMWILTSVSIPVVKTVWLIASNFDDFTFNSFSNIIMQIIIFGLFLIPILIVVTLFHGFVAGREISTISKKIILLSIALCVGAYLFLILKPSKFSTESINYSLQLGVMSFIIVSSFVLLTSPEIKKSESIE